MKKIIKRALPFVVIMAMTLMLATGAFASSSMVKVIDNEYMLTVDQIDDINYLLEDFTATTGVGAFYAVRGSNTLDTMPTSEYADAIVAYYTDELGADMPSRGIVIVSDFYENVLHSYPYGGADLMFDETVTGEIFDVMVGYDSDGMYLESVEAGLGVALEAVNEYYGLDIENDYVEEVEDPVAPTYAGQYTAGTPIVDEADLLTAEEEATLISQIEQIKSLYNIDVTFITTYDTGGLYIEDYIEFHPALDQDADGVVFGLDMTNRDFFTIGRNFGQTTMTDEALIKIEDDVVPYLSRGDYFGAYSEYLDSIEIFAEASRSGVTYSGPLIPEGVLGTALLVGVVSGAIISFIITKMMINDMNTARKQREASVYTRPGSFNITRSYDRFLFEHTTRTAKPKASSSKSSGGGGGSSRGGRSGGKF